MAFQLSPGVLVTERDLTNIIPAVATSNGAVAGPFVWGPVMDPTTISSENQLVARFGKPVDDNQRTFFTAANFLSYSSNLLVIRTDGENARNAVAVQSGSIAGVTIIDGGADYTAPTVVIGAPDVAGGTQAVATAIVEGGVITGFTFSGGNNTAGSGYNSTPSISVTDADGAGFSGTTTITAGGVKINNSNFYDDTFAFGAGLFGEFAAKYPGALGNSIGVSMADAASFDDWVYAAEFDAAPSTSTGVANTGGEDDELHVIVVDSQGIWTGQVGAVLEKYAFLSKASDSRKSDGSNNFYKDVINSQSKYVWWMDHPTEGANWGTQGANTSFDALGDAITRNLSGGVDDLAPTQGQYQDAYEIFANTELYDVQLVMAGGVEASTSQWIVNNVAESRKDCVAFISPVLPDGEVIRGVDAIEEIIAFRQGTAFNVNSSYAVLDSGYKYQYDRYNDVYRWVPLNGDIAGLCARTDLTNDPWWSPGGLNRGQIKNVVKLAVNPNKTDRDNLYKNGINPVVSFPGQGTVLFGDKTLLAKPSAFDRINVRRLFIVLEKAIATAAKFQLFEFNDPFTRAQFRSLVEPFLRDVQGRRGVIDFRVVCDERNNTGEVIDRNEFVADIFIKPNRAINFITLNFIAARTGISFDEIGA